MLYQLHRHPTLTFSEEDCWGYGGGDVPTRPPHSSNSAFTLQSAHQIINLLAWGLFVVFGWEFFLWPDSTWQTFSGTCKWTWQRVFNSHIRQMSFQKAKTRSGINSPAQKSNGALFIICFLKCLSHPLSFRAHPTRTPVPTRATARPHGDACYPAATRSSQGLQTTGRSRLQEPPPEEEGRRGPADGKGQDPEPRGGWEREADSGTTVSLSITRGG